MAHKEEHAGDPRHYYANTGADLIQCMQELERELGLRVRMYPTWIADDKLGKYEAQDRMRRYEGVMQFMDWLICQVQSDKDGTLQAKIAEFMTKLSKPSDGPGTVKGGTGGD